MRLLAMLDRDEERDARFDASLHGVRLEGDARSVADGPPQPSALGAARERAARRWRKAGG